MTSDVLLTLVARLLALYAKLSIPLSNNMLDMGVYLYESRDREDQCQLPDAEASRPVAGHMIELVDWEIAAVAHAEIEAYLMDVERVR
ncbi:hypothetical protein BGZ57DRAFT_904282 [Hyaloscypha finlandica]|nr:hypothetical protein BGZ57DRAFT_904282 [Hyaloscypha finlandica]